VLAEQTAALDCSIVALYDTVVTEFLSSRTYLGDKLKETIHLRTPSGNRPGSSRQRSTVQYYNEQQTEQDFDNSFQ